MNIDILIAVGKSGGVENVINQLGKFLHEKNSRVRLIQTMYEGDSWTDPSDIEFIYLYWGLASHDLDDFSTSYHKLLTDTYVPDIILCAAIPYMCMVARAASSGFALSPVIVSWLHAPIEKYAASGYGDIEALKYADYHFCISQTIKKGLSALPEDKIISVCNPINLSVQNPDVRAKEPGNSLVFIGRISPEKHIETILDALHFAKSRWTLSIYGNQDDDLSRQLIDYSKSLGLNDQVFWNGWCQNPWSSVKNADFLVMASEYEGFPLVAIEAQANGLPVISTPVSGIIDIIAPGENGYLFPIGDFGFLAEILDNIDSGLLPYPPARNCLEKAQPYLAENALADFTDKLNALLQN